MQSSSVAWRQGGGATTKMENKKNTTFSTILRQSFALELTKKFLKHLLKHTFREASLSKTKLKNQQKLWKMAKNKQSNLIYSLQELNIGFTKKYVISLEIGLGIGWV